MERALTGMERMMWMGGQVLPINFALCARVAGSLAHQEVRTALDKVGRRHPLAAVRVAVDAEGRPFFTRADVAPAEILHLTQNEDWVTVTQRELVRLFNGETGPFIRLVWLDAGDTSDLILICDHTIADGLSAALLLRDLLTYLGDPTRPVDPLALRPPLTHLIPEAVQRSFSPEAFLAERMAAPVTQARAVPSLDALLSRPTPQLRLQPWRLNAPYAAHLLAQCRAQETTVHGAIGAAFLLAFAQHDTEAATTRIIQSPVNLRSMLEPPVGEDFGLFINHVTAAIDCTPGRDFWAIARDVRNRVHAQIADPGLMTRALVAEHLMTLSDVEQVLRSMAAFIETGYDLSITNLGRLDMPTRYGPFSLNALYGPILCVSPGETVLGVNAVGGSIHLILACETHADTVAVGETALKALDSALGMERYRA